MSEKTPTAKENNTPSTDNNALPTDNNTPSTKNKVSSKKSESVTFPHVTAWPMPVDGAALLEALKREVERFVVVAEDEAIAIALWVLFTWTLLYAQVSPILALTSPEKRCGKTTLLRVLNKITKRPLLSGNVTPAVVFRIVHRFQPTLLIDEADTFIDAKNELVGILNSSHHRDAAYVLRASGENYKPERFSTWCPKAIALIGDLPPTLRDRSIEIRMKRRMPNERVEKLGAGNSSTLSTLASQCCRWADDCVGKIAQSNIELPEGLNDRAEDNWEHLVAIADLAGGPWPQRARLATVWLSEADQDEDRSDRVELLGAIEQLFRQQDADFLRSMDICGLLNMLEDRPWSGWKTGFVISPRKLASMLRAFGIEPIQTRIETEVVRGYRFTDFEDAFARYLDI